MTKDEFECLLAAADEAINRGDLTEFNTMAIVGAASALVGTGVEPLDDEDLLVLAQTIGFHLSLADMPGLRVVLSLAERIVGKDVNTEEPFEDLELVFFRTEDNKIAVRSSIGDVTFSPHLLDTSTDLQFAWDYQRAAQEARARGEGKRRYS